MNETRVEDLLRENFEQFTIYIGNIESILFNSIDITNFITIDPFGRQNPLIKDINVSVTLDYEGSIECMLSTHR